MISKHLHSMVGLRALVTDELGTLAAKSCGCPSWAHLTLSSHLPLHLLKFSMYFFHSIHKKSGWQQTRVILREECISATLRTREGLIGASPPRESLNTLLAVVVKTGQDLWILKEIIWHTGQVTSCSSSSIPFCLSSPPDAIDH